MNIFKEWFLRIFKGYEKVRASKVREEGYLRHPKRKNYDVLACRSKETWISHYLVKERETSRS